MRGFSRSYRLISKTDFQSVFAQAEKLNHKKMLVLYAGNQMSHARLGIIIKKIDIKLAVQRNRYRRWIRESFRQHQEALKNLDIIVILRSKLSPNDSSSFRKDIADLWLKLSKH